MRLEFYRHGKLSVCPVEAEPPAGARRAAAPFAPLVFLLNRDPLNARAAFSPRTLKQALGPEDTRALSLDTAYESGAPRELQDILLNGGARAVNAAWPGYEDLLAPPLRPAQARINLAGLGDVGGAMLMGLRLLGGGLISEIGIYDPNRTLAERYEQEINQMLPLEPNARVPQVRIVETDCLFDCDVFAFAASRGVPEPGGGDLDVRMAQLKSNMEIIAPYARMAREKGFKGLFAQVSDPVDLLCRCVFVYSNRDENGNMDYLGLRPEQIRGFGLGVMSARAAYWGDKSGLCPDFAARGRAYGPHGGGLVIANDTGDGYDGARSDLLTKYTVEANLRVRETGFKPYLAPGVSSACIGILRLLSGRWQDSAVPLGGAYMGCRNRESAMGLEVEALPLNPALQERIGCAYARLIEESSIL